ncbi:class I SAM-dependent methyltransferase [Pelagibius sp.]|uniref:class I SAM-dependent methyltransferase n=1 Tax=Pelagibius sp. TaxID=1931238 RepID=UPI0026040934|nr:class I SAM-dependent methyltransferase [Pelagibius sp.]
MSDHAEELKTAKLLDIGVGAGRTTARFAAAVRDYVGADYSPSMVEAVTRKFAGKLENARFEQADARDLGNHAEGSFDAILFSFNGLDTLGAEERAMFLDEARRVLRDDGLLAFSSHNLSALDQVFRFKRARSVAKLIEHTKRKAIQLSRNPPLSKLMARDWALVYDGTHGKLLRHYYVTPPAQVRQLAEHGFGEIRVIDTKTGDELEPDSRAAARARWPYFFARAQKRA